MLIADVPPPSVMSAPNEPDCVLTVPPLMFSVPVAEPEPPANCPRIKPELPKSRFPVPDTLTVPTAGHPELMPWSATVIPVTSMVPLLKVKVPVALVAVPDAAALGVRPNIIDVAWISA